MSRSRSISCLMCARAASTTSASCSRATRDLVPALEAVVALRAGERPRCEVAAWAPPRGRPRSLAVRGVHLRHHLLGEADFRAVADETDYTIGR